MKNNFKKLLPQKHIDTEKTKSLSFDRLTSAFGYRFSRCLCASVVTIFALLTTAPAHAALNIFACEPEWAALTQELAGDHAQIYTATNALQDPHRVEARPSLIAKARRADLVVCTGAELELAWLPVVLRESGNAKVSAGKSGYFEAAHYVTMLELPGRLDRADGDVHEAGNPHIQLDARNYVPIARALSARLSEIDAANSAFYAARLQTFEQKWATALQRWERQAAPLNGTKILVQHRAFPYLSAWLGLKEIAALESKPGMESSVAHLSQVLAEVKQSTVPMVIRAAYQNPKPSQWIAERSAINAVVLPFSVGGDDSAPDLFGLFDDTVARLLAGLQKH
jgi:zinc/manganese transport system substrate-binding protein